MRIGYEFEMVSKSESNRSPIGIRHEIYVCVCGACIPGLPAAASILSSARASSSVTVTPAALPLRSPNFKLRVCISVLAIRNNVIFLTVVVVVVVLVFFLRVCHASVDLELGIAQKPHSS